MNIFIVILHIVVGIILISYGIKKILKVIKRIKKEKN